MPINSRNAKRRCGGFGLGDLLEGYMYGWNWVRNAAYPTLKPTQDVLGAGRSDAMGPE